MQDQEQDLAGEVSHLAVRLVALETVMQQLLIRLAVRSDDPGRWVAQRKTLALKALGAAETPTQAVAADLCAAARELFEEVEDSVARLG